VYLPPAPLTVSPRLPALYGLIALAAATLVNGLGLASAAEVAGPPLAFTDCLLESPAGIGAVAARCGELTVAENPAAPRSRQIALHVAVVPALNRRAQPDPLFVLAGGPGQAATDFYAGYAGAFATIGRDRDIVLVDQRGTGKSAPLLCEYPEDPEAPTVGPEQLRKATLDCLAKLDHDPRYYTTTVAVGDLEAVRRALGAEQINLYGVSYGTRVAQHYLRRFPQRVRTVVLDGAVPPQVLLGPDMALDAQHTLDAILTRCRQDAACNDRFPNVATEFRALQQRLDTPVRLTFPDPATGKTQTLDFGAEHLGGVVRLLSYSDGTAALLPLLIHSAQAENNLVPLAAQYLLIEQTIESQFAYGMHNAVVCTEDLPLINRQQVNAQELAATYLGTASLDGLSALCGVWPAGVLDADLHQPMKSDTPVLILSGGNDPITPVRYGEQVLAQFTKGRHLVIEGYGHGQLASPCVPGLLARFVNLGDTQGLDTRCVAGLRAAPFLLDFTGPAP
jgi:pimeloyl-ACP methyl ester carboxylesterase